MRNANKLTIAVGLLLGLLPALAGLARADGEAAPTSQRPPAAPDLRGPYPVGVTTVTLYDYSRADPHTKKEPRALKTEIWYPATERARELPLNKHSDFWDRGTNQALNSGLKMAFGVDMAELDERFENDAYRDARVRDGRYPLIVFSHGNGGVRMQSLFWCEHMASHGYIVVAPDHTGNAMATTVDGKLVLMDRTPNGRTAAAGARPKDVSFVIDSMERFDKGADSRFTGRIDVERVGVAGHSFGGYTATMAVEQDDRIDAISPWTVVGFGRKKHDVPVMVLVATEDATIQEAGNRQTRLYYEQSKGPRYLVEFKNAGHFSFTEMHQYRPEFGDGVGKGKRITNGEPLEYVSPEVVFRHTNGYTLAFFDRFLKGDQSRDEYLAKNHLPDEIIYANGGVTAAAKPEAKPSEPAEKPRVAY